MEHYKLRNLIFLTLCCDMGLFAKRMIAPVANILTDYLRIPGGIGTSFSIMFLVVASALVSQKGCATIMGLVQSMIALSLGMVGSMGALSPIGYIVPGMAIDIIIWLARRIGINMQLTMVAANMFGAAAAGFTANIIVFHLNGTVLLLYVIVALISGATCGLLADMLAARLRPVLTANTSSVVKEKKKETKLAS